MRPHIHNPPRAHLQYLVLLSRFQWKSVSQNLTSVVQKSITILEPSSKSSLSGSDHAQGGVTQFLNRQIPWQLRVVTSLLYLGLEYLSLAPHPESFFVPCRFVELSLEAREGPKCCCTRLYMKIDIPQRSNHSPSSMFQ